MSFMEWNVMNSAWSNKVCEINWGLAEDKIKFPKKLWDLVNSGRTRAVKWGQDGASLVVDYDQLTDYLRSPNSIFMTKKVSSFTRQLNIYGFKKVSQANRQLRDFTRENHSRIHLFYHKYFIKDREDLLQFMTRKSHHQCCYQINKKRIHDPDNDHIFDASKKLTVANLASFKSQSDRLSDLETKFNAFQEEIIESNSLIEHENDDGKIEEWDGFFSVYSATIDQNSALIDAEKFIHLRGHLKDDALAVISKFYVSGENYKFALDKLFDRQRSEASPRSVLQGARITFPQGNQYKYTYILMSDNEKVDTVWSTGELDKYETPFFEQLKRRKKWTKPLDSPLPTKKTLVDNPPDPPKEEKSLDNLYALSLWN
ncbi:hypothetical protein AAG570_002008 [Ranatra chinensis]|uniref:HSF-type DNA-binding domain-containing protein n=1 Tax=Ranatra chinensis TaxID=642074 RepID=A0ABD0YWN8_9HEMI